MTPSPPVPGRQVRDALVLAAGNGDRFQNNAKHSKLLQPILGQPLILRTLDTAREAGITRMEVVLGYEAGELRALIEQHAPAGATVHFTFNPRWQLENGLSVLAARDRLNDRRFALLMGDHLFESVVLTHLVDTAVVEGESLLAVDSRAVGSAIADEATKVRLDGGSRIVAIGKDLAEYDALDTGLFVCAPSVFAALDGSCAEGDTTLSGGIRRLAERGLMRAVDIAGAAWCDIDTPADLRAAETMLGQPEHA